MSISTRTVSLGILTAILSTASSGIVRAQSGTTAGNPTLLLPKDGIYFGAWVLPEGPKGGGNATEDTKQLETQIGRKLAVHVHYYGWHSNFPDAVMNDDAENGRIPMVSWESGGTMKETIAGSDDAMLIERAKAVKAWGKPMFIRYMWEMNLMLPAHLKVYGGSRDGAGALYVATWRHIWKVFHDQGVTNVVWVWNPSSAEKIAEGPRVDAAPFYPGDEYVDWIGMDAYDRTETRVGYVKVFEFFYNEFKSHNKPTMIVETGAFPGLQTQYLHEVQTLTKTVFPLIKGFLYFDAPGHTVHPWSLTPDGIKAFAELGKDPYFQGHP
jgi:hypothetical protein